MSGDDFGPVLKGVATELKTIVGLLKEWASTNDKIAKSTRGIGGSVSNNSGNGLGKGSTAMMDGALGHFSGFGSSFGGVSRLIGSATGMGSFGSSVAASAIGNAPKIIGGIGKLMPDTATVFSRADTSYAGVVASGGMYSRAQIEAMGARGLGNNQTGVNSDVQTTSYLAGRGMMPGTATFTQTLRTTGGLSQFMGMSNQSAAAAIEGLSSGAGSSNLLRNFGVLTGNAATGQSLTPQQIISQIKGRLNAGRGGYTTQQVMDSYRKGNLGASLQASGLDADQQAIVMQSILGDATDSKTGPLNLDDPKSMERASKAMGGNPNDPLNKIYATQNKVAGAGEDSYIAGAKVAADALSGLGDVASSLAQTFGGLKSAVETWSGSHLGQGTNDVLGGIASIGATALTAKYGGKALGKLMGGLGKGGGGLGGGGLGGLLGGGAKSTLGSMGTTLKEGFGAALKGSKGVGVMSAAAGAMTAASGLGTSHQGADIGRGIGEMAGGWGGWAAAAALAPETGGLSFLLPILGSFVGSKVLGDIGAGIGGMFDPKGAGGETGDQGANKAFRLYRPVRQNLAPTATYGQKYYKGQLLWKNGHHGIDYPVSKGTAVLASADGTVVQVGTMWAELGLAVMIQHPQSPNKQMSTIYGHLSAASVTVGQTVTAGQVIGASGNSGTHTTGEHLHFGLSKSQNIGDTTDPSPYMGGDAPPVSQENAADAAGAASSTGSAGSATGSSSSSAGASATIIGSGISGGFSGVSGSAQGIASIVGAAGSMSGGSGSVGVGGETGGTSVAGFGNTAAALQGTRGIGGRAGLGGSAGTNININLQIQNANESEARKFATRVKEILEEQKRLESMGSR